MKRILALALLLVASCPGIAPAKSFGSCPVDVPAAWLPQIQDGFAPWRQHEALESSHAHADRFVYRRHPLQRQWDTTQPVGGTFVYVVGPHGPEEKGRLAFDYARGIAFYDVGCCSSFDRVVAYAPHPPYPVANANLSAVHTVRGIALGASPADVRRAYGRAAAFHAVPGHAGLRMLSYAAMSARSNSCGQSQNFIFRDEQLVSIELLDGC